MVSSIEGARKGVLGVTRTEDRTAVPTRERTVPGPVEKPVPAPAPERRKRTEPLRKRTLIQKLTRSLALRLAALSIILGGGTAATVYEINPTFHEKVNNALNVGETRALPYDPASLKPQEIKAGPNGNARAMTEEEVRSFINQTPPVFKKPKPQEQAPKIEVVLSVDPENAKQLSIANVTQRGLNGDNVSYYVDNLKIQIRGDNVPFGIPIVPGAKEVDAKVGVNASGRIEDVELRYYFDDGTVGGVYINFWDNNVIPTATMNSIPQYDANILKTRTKINASPVKRFDLEKTPSVKLFYPKGSTTISLTPIAKDNDYSILSLSPRVIEGDVSYLP